MLYITHGERTLSQISHRTLKEIFKLSMVKALHCDITPSQSVKIHRRCSVFCPVYLRSLFNLRYISELINWLIELFIFRANLITCICDNCVCCRIINNHWIHCNHNCWLVFCCKKVKRRPSVRWMDIFILKMSHSWRGHYLLISSVSIRSKWSCTMHVGIMCA